MAVPRSDRSVEIDPTVDSTASADCDLQLGFLLTAVVLLRLLLPITPDRIFDVDPGQVAGPMSAIGPSGSTLLDALLIGLSALALWSVGRRRGLDLGLVLLISLPLPVLLWHASGDVLQTWRAIDWFAAATTGVALAHLVADRRVRVVVLAMLLGGIVVMACRGVHQVAVEHADTVSFFDDNRADILAARGWLEDSPAALAFERRLRQPEATGWIGFSNIFSGLAAAGCIGLAGVLAVSRRRGHEAGGPVLLGLAAITMAVLVGVNGSKGAIAAGLLGSIALLVLFGPLGSRFRARPGLIIVLAGIVAFLAILLRGWLPESFLGDRSLLFRWHYLQGAWGMFTSSPLVGVGPDGFQDAYLQVKPARSPEDVASAHSMTVDWMASIGVVAVAWIMAAVRLVLPPSDSSVKDEAPASTAFVWTGRRRVAVVLVGLGIFAIQSFVESPLEVDGVILRIVALVMGTFVAAVAIGLLADVPESLVRAVAVAAAVVIAAQAQIEMLFWQSGSVAFCWAFLAVAGGAGPIGGRSTPSSRSSIRVLTVTACFVVLAIGSTIAAVRMGFSEAQVGRSVVDLYRTPDDDRPSPSASDRRIAALSLSAGVVEDGHWNDERRIRGAIEQFMAAGEPEDVNEALRIADAWFAARPGPASSAVRASVLQVLANASVDPEVDEQALAAIDDAIEFDPRDPIWQVVRAARLVDLDRCAEAMLAVASSRELDEQRELDPLVRLGAIELERLNAIELECRGRASDSVELD
jgi:hypothetical protein